MSQYEELMQRYKGHLTSSRALLVENLDMCNAKLRNPKLPDNPTARTKEKYLIAILTDTLHRIDESIKTVDSKLTSMHARTAKYEQNPQNPF